jgi:HEAT repeat protein
MKASSPRLTAAAASINRIRIVIILLRVQSNGSNVPPQGIGIESPSVELIEPGRAKAMELHEVEKLKRRGDAATVDALICALLDADYLTRGDAARALGEIGDHRAADALLAIFERDHAKWPRRAAAEALGRLGEARAFEPLVRMLTRDTEPYLRAGAAVALGLLGDPGAVTALVPALDDMTEDVRAAAAAALERMPGPGAVDALCLRLDDGCESVRLQVARALAACGDTRALTPLMKLLDSPHFRVRRSASEALKRMGWRPVGVLQRARWAVACCDWDAAENCGAAAAAPFLTVLKEAAEEEFEDDQIAYGAIEVRDQMETLLASKGREIDEPIVRELAELGYPITHRIRVIGRELTDHVCWATEELGDTSRVAALARAELKRRGDMSMLYGELDDLERLESADPEIVWPAAERLGKRKSERAAEALLVLLEHDSSTVRGYAANALGMIGDPHATDPLIAMLEWDESEWPRRTAARALGRLSNARAVEPLVRALAGDREYSVRAAVAYALRPLGDSRSVEPLLTALREESDQVRIAAASALETVPDPRAVEPLATALSDDHEYVRLHAARALASNSDARALPALIAMLAGSEFFIRSSAAEALERRAWWPEGDAERGAWAVAHCAWGEAAACGAAAAKPLLAVVREAWCQCDDADTAYRIDGAREALEMVLESSAAQIDQTVLEELAETEASINYPVVTRVEGNSIYLDAEEVSNTNRMAALALAELERRGVDPAGYDEWA